jgi:S-adenosylmethionine:tRNA ribosyltransferase-isomerase
MKTSDFDYLLPEELIAQTPIEPRDHSRLMVLSHDTGKIEHRRFYDLPDYLAAGDVMVFNNSRVFPARLYAKRTDTAAQVELLLLDCRSTGEWRALVKPGRRMRPGATFEVAGDDEPGISGEVVEIEPDGSRIVRLSGEERLHELGVVPLPPYIHEPLADAERYQTVYSRVAGSVAAPTAGLHFTEALLDRIRKHGVETVFVTLHVGWDSFRPVDTEDPSAHDLHTESWEMSAEAALAINRAKDEGRRVISVGTTAVRLLEHAAMLGDGLLREGSGRADLLILPGHRFRVIDALVTNFHLPRSTLLMLTSAFAGREQVLNAYQEAASRRYRFYSFGDAMLVL